MTWLAKRLKSLMSEHELPLESVARQLAVERSRMAKILAGEALPNPPLTRRIARLFDEDSGEWLDKTHAGSSDCADAPGLPTGFVKVAKVSELPEGEMKIVFNDLVAIARVDGELYAFGNVCPHAAGPIGDGFLDGCIVECPWHSGRWDIKTGKALTMIATADIPLINIRTVDDDIEIELNDAVLTPDNASSTLDRG